MSADTNARLSYWKLAKTAYTVKPVCPSSAQLEARFTTGEASHPCAGLRLKGRDITNLLFARVDPPAPSSLDPRFPCPLCRWSPRRKAGGFAPAGTSGTRSTREEYAPVACISGLRPSAFRVANGHRTRSGMRLREKERRQVKMVLFIFAVDTQLQPAAARQTRQAKTRARQSLRFLAHAQIRSRTLSLPT